METVHQEIIVKYSYLPAQTCPASQTRCVHTTERTTAFFQFSKKKL